MILLATSKVVSTARTLLVLAVVATVLGGTPRVAFSQQTPPVGDGGRYGGGNAPALNDNGTDAPDTDTDTNGGGDGDEQTDTPNPAQANQATTTQRMTDGAGRGMGRRAILEDRLRQLIARNGVTSRTTQDAILDFMRQDEENKQNVRDASHNLWNGLRRDVPSERLRFLLSDYQKALQQQHDERLKAQTALDARVGYSLDPHLESLLWLLGVLGEAQNVLNVPRGPVRTPHMTPPNGGANPYSLQTVERQIDGVVNAKNGDNENLVWLEIRDVQGQLWRVTPQNDPNARLVLVRQIQALVLGTHIVVRVATLPVQGVTTPLLLLAIIPAANTGANAGVANAVGP